jgi:hypothetical protein
MTITCPQEAALKWLRSRNGTGCFDKHGSSRALAAGELAPVMRSTWNALRDAGCVRIEGKRVTIMEKEAV